ncbi:MAG TPA: threonine/serine dehydratase [Gemmatimonadales bacterium]|nr:threonine/serine dehydratase [Gemmatimonadales bacterium]
MTLTTLGDLQAARQRIANAVHRTPLFSASSLGAPLGISLYLKAELFQKTGSFKVRGVLNKVRQLPAAEIARGFITLSAGNHGAALSWAAHQAGSRATVVMPAHAVPAKVEAVRNYGGEPVLTTAPLKDEMQRIQAERGLTLVHPFDDPEIIAGHGSAGLEILEDLPEVDAVIVPVGGGGLISGIASAIKLSRPATQVIGVEPVGADVMSRSLAAGRPEKMDKMTTVADGLAAPFAGEHTFAHVQRFVDRIVLVDDDAILRALRAQIVRAKLAAEPAGAASLAALMSGAITFPAKTRVVCFVSGGNADPAVLQRALGVT